jgi:formate hydrogenlyase subunit 6/NADH:ubiquinone oxidoreductase subunit I
MISYIVCENYSRQDLNSLNILNLTIVLSTNDTTMIVRESLTMKRAYKGRSRLIDDDCI